MAELVFDDLNALQIRKTWNAAVQAIKPDSFAVEASTNVKVKTFYAEEGAAQEVDETQEAVKRAVKDIERLAHDHLARFKWLEDGFYEVRGNATLENLGWLTQIAGDPLIWPLSSPTIRLFKAGAEKALCDTHRKIIALNLSDAEEKEFNRLRT
jgi:hypothetical protein